MIASISGTVLASKAGTTTIEVGGIGFLVHTTNKLAASLVVGVQATLQTVLIVREDSLTLFGFLDATELETFELLRTVNGVGPKSALAILSALSVQEIAKAVSSESDTIFKSVSGVGVKTAKLIVVSLSGKLPWGTAGSSKPSISSSTVLALVGLGYSDKEATKAVSAIFSSELSEPEILKLALQHLARGASQ